MFAKSCDFLSFNLNSNQLEGLLPQSLVNYQHLEVFDIVNNHVNDTSSHWLEILPKLQVIILRSN